MMMIIRERKAKRHIFKLLFSVSNIYLPNMEYLSASTLFATQNLFYSMWMKQLFVFWEFFLIVIVIFFPLKKVLKIKNFHLFFLGKKCIWQNYPKFLRPTNLDMWIKRGMCRTYRYILQCRAYNVLNVPKSYFYPPYKLHL